MSYEQTIKPIARIRTDFPTKFGIPRQAGLAGELKGKIVFEPAFRIDRGHLVLGAEAVKFVQGLGKTFHIFRQLVGGILGILPDLPFEDLK